MPLRSVQPGSPIGARPGETVVCIPVYGGHELFVWCLQSVLAHTPDEVTILVCDDASPDPRSGELLEARAGEAAHTVMYARRERNVGFPANVNDAFAAAAPADVAVLNSDCVVAQGWLEGLRDAAYLDERVATATAMTNNGTIVSVPEFCRPSPTLPEGWTLEAAAAAVRAHSQRLRPALITAIGHCMYVRRSALELVGDFDLAFSPGYGEEVDFSQRCLQHGLRHVAADEVLVLHHGGASFAPEGAPPPVQNEHERLLLERYPYYHDWVRVVEADRSGPLASAIGAARRALNGVRVVLDSGGTAAQTSEIAAADVVHRLDPFTTDHELWSLAREAHRLVLSAEDPHAYGDPSRFSSFAAWERRRRLATIALAIADRVVFASEGVRAATIRDGLIESARASVVAARDERGLRDVYGAACDAPANPARAVVAGLGHATRPPL